MKVFSVWSCQYANIVVFFSFYAHVQKHMWAWSMLEVGIYVNTNEITLFFLSFSLSFFFLDSPCHFKMMTNTGAPSRLLLLYNPPSNLPLIFICPCLSPRPLYVQVQLKSIQSSSVLLKGHSVNTGPFFSFLFFFSSSPYPIADCLASHFSSRHYSISFTFVWLYYNKQDMLISCFVGCFVSCQPVFSLSSVPS